MLTLHRTVIRRVIGGTPAGARPFVYPSFDGTAGESAAHSREAERSSVRTAGSSILPRPFVTAQCLTEEASHEVTMPRTPREGTTDIHRNERPVQGDTAGRFTTAAGAAESPCRTDAAYTNTNGGSAAE